MRGLLKLAKKVLKRKTWRGRANALIDGIFHRGFPDPVYVALDTCAHFLVEADDPRGFVRKFARYNLKYFVPGRKKRR